MSGTDTQTATQASTGNNRPAFLAFCMNPESAAALKQFAATKSWPENAIHQGDITAATEYLKSHPSPHVLCVDIPSQAEAGVALDNLADVCDPSTKVVAVGTVNEYSFFVWLMEMGISSYLLHPLTEQSLEGAYRKAGEVPQAPATPVEAKQETKLISIIGARGGAGATTVAVNLGWILADHLKQKTALLDFDPQLGSVALALDLEAGKGLRDALEKPERMDGLFMDRVMVKVDENFSILSAEEPLEENIIASEAAAAALFTQTRSKFSHVLVDVPRILSPFTRYALKHATDIICVTEYTIMGLRESLRYLDYCREILKVKTPLFIANKVGLAGKHQMPQAEFEKGLGEKISYSIPFVLDAYAAATAGEVLAEMAKNNPATKVLHHLAAHFVEGAEVEQKPANMLQSLLGSLKGGK